MEPAATAARFPGWLRVVRIIAIGRNPKRTLMRAGVLGVVCFVFFKFYFFEQIIRQVRVDGNSMFPTYHDGTRNYVNKLAYRHADPKRGDVVAIRMAGEHEMLLKRIVGLPGETVAFAHGKLLINGKDIDEPYLKQHSLPPDMDPVTLKPDEYYVIGDNRMMSDQGRIDRSRIVGRIIL
jgi:signal peptidase I